MAETKEQQTQIPIQDALNAAWAKVGQLTYQIDLMSQQMVALVKENKKLKEQKQRQEEKSKEENAQDAENSNHYNKYKRNSWQCVNILS